MSPRVARAETEGVFGMTVGEWTSVLSVGISTLAALGTLVAWVIVSIGKKLDKLDAKIDAARLEVRADIARVDARIEHVDRRIDRLIERMLPPVAG